MTLSTIIGAGGHALLLSAIILRLAHGLNLTRNHAYILTITTMILTLIPMYPLSAVQFTRGVLGDLSITSMVLLVRFLIMPQAPLQESRQLFILVCIGGVMFYPAALGLGMTDPYQWGYLNSYRGVEIPLLFLGGLTVLMIIARRMENSLILLCIVAALGAFLLEVMESRNIWDYLIDPMIVIYGLVSLSLYFTKIILGKQRARKHITS